MSEANVWWGAGSPNIPLKEASYMQNRCIAMAYLHNSPRLYVQDGFVNWGAEVCQLL